MAQHEASYGGCESPVEETQQTLRTIGAFSEAWGPLGPILGLRAPSREGSNPPHESGTAKLR